LGSTVRGGGAAAAGNGRGLALLTGGGTGGHLYPAVAVARELMRAGFRTLLVGSRHGRESQILAAEGLEFRALRVYGLVGKGPAARLKALLALPLAVLAALVLLAAQRPRFVFGTGGYAAAPLMIAAILLRVPVALHESNRIPGLTNRILGRLVDLRFVAFRESVERFRKTALWTGTPVRAEFGEIAPPLPAERLRLLIFGGSSGAASLDRLALAALRRLEARRDQLEIAHQVSALELERVAAYYRSGAWQAEAAPYFMDLPRRMAQADLVICRAGAVTVAELAAAGRASILVPLPAAAHDHQRANAAALAAAGAATVVEQDGAAEAKLAVEIGRYLQHRALAAEVGARARGLARPGAAREIAERLQEL
jgi:UDP-N-acetylglucosamine--N-acetylmuramyl-(pentapeptide) pyrophosphoryl-undecaprenol N-acetylglucosamine transferase